MYLGFLPSQLTMWEVEWLIELAWQWIAMTRNNLSIIWISSNQLTHQIYKSEAALEYAIIDLKPPRLWALKKKNKVLECLYFMFFVVDPIQQAHKWSEITSKEDFSFLKFTELLQSCCCPVQKNLPRKAELACQVSRGSVNFKMKKSRPLFTIILKSKIVISRLKILFHLMKEF